MKVFTTFKNVFLKILIVTKWSQNKFIDFQRPNLKGTATSLH